MNWSWLVDHAGVLFTISMAALFLLSVLERIQLWFWKWRIQRERRRGMGE